jgi:hypothetical protein
MAATPAAAARLAGAPLKRMVLGGALAAAILQYYFIEVQLQILKQPSLTVFAPTSRSL